MEIFGYDFFRNALVGVLLLSVASAVIGTYIVTRRLVSISGGVTHACFGGLGLGYFLGWNPVVMAAVFAVASSLGVQWLARRHRVREDSAIAVIWALGMALGTLFIFLTPGYVPELNAFLFGNILTITRGAFDPDFAAVRHMPVVFISTVMTVMVAVCIVLTIRLVGVMLLMSMLALPQMIAETFCNRFKPMMLLSIAISLGCCIGGLFLATVIEVPCSALIVLTMTLAYIIARIFAFFRKFAPRNYTR